MLEEDYGAELARAVARTLVVDRQRSGAQPQHSALLEMNPKSDRIQDALAYARLNLKTRLSVEMLADAARLGPRQFSRALRAETGLSPAKAVERLRVEAARLMIQTSRHTVDVVAAETGFGDQEADAPGVHPRPWPFAACCAGDGHGEDGQPVGAGRRLRPPPPMGRAGAGAVTGSRPAHNPASSEPDRLCQTENTAPGNAARGEK